MSPRARALALGMLLAPALTYAHPSSTRADADAGARASAFDVGRSLDPLDLARAANRAGDGAIERALTADDADPVHRRIALESSPFAHAPIRLVVPIARLAAGRDPDLAPAAMRVLVAITERWVPNDLARHEVMPADLAPARAAMRALRRDATAREDLRSAAGRVDGAFASLLD